jgi:hypothetical protein
MAEPKTKATGQSVDAFLDAIEDERRRADCRSLVAMMREATKAEPEMWGAGIVGFGRYRYKYESGREGEWPIVGFSPRKGDLSLYLMPGVGSLGDLTAKLGKYKTGKACLYIRRLEDVDAKVLEAMITKSVALMKPQRVD